MATDHWQEILKQVEKLSPAEQLAILDELRRRAESHSRPTPTRSILELEGLAAEIWEGIDAQDYVRRERESWTG